MAAEEANLDFDWRDPTNRSILDQPWPLENYTGVKCYRNVIFIWLFHTPLLLNWIDDNHGSCKGCLLCTLCNLARSFWHRKRHLDENFKRDVDEFWKITRPDSIIDLYEQNDSEEYLKGLLGFLSINCDDKKWDWIFSVQKHCIRVCVGCKNLTQSTEKDYILQGTFAEAIEYKPLCRILEFNKLEEFGCGKCSKGTEHEFSSGLLNAPPILVVHCKPYTYGELVSGIYRSYLSGKVTRLEHSMAFSTYSDKSLDPKTINWAFYHLYGVILRRGDTGSTGHYVCAFEQRQTGRWLFFNDSHDSGSDDSGRRVFEEVTEPWTRSQLDEKVDEMQKGDWRIFMLMYRKLFQVPIRLLTRITFPSTAIALQDQQSHEESGELETGESGGPEVEDAQEEYFTPGECVGDEDLLGSECGSGQTRGETQGAADDEELQGGPSDSETRNLQAEQLMPTELPAVETDPESSTSKSATEHTQEAADNVSQRDASDSGSQPGQTEQPLPADLPTEQGVEFEADLGLSTAAPDATKTGSRAQAEKSTQKETQVEDENEQMTTSQPASETVRTEVEPSVQPKKKQVKGKAAKRSHDKALDEDEETSTSVPASKKARTGAKSSTQPKKKETNPKATKRTQTDASDDHEDEKVEKPELSSRRAKTVVEPSTGYGGRETRSRAAAKRVDGEIPDVDKNEDEQTATAKPASKKAKTTKPPAQPGKAQPKSKAGRKK